MGAGPVDGSVAAATPLVRQWRRVSDARDDEATDDACQPVLVPREPAIEPMVPGTKRSRYESRRGRAANATASLREQHDPGEVVVRERRADVRRQEHLRVRRALQEALAVGWRARRQGAVHDDLVRPSAEGV